MQESIVFLLRVQCRRKESSRSLSRSSPDEFLVLSVAVHFFPQKLTTFFSYV